MRRASNSLLTPQTLFSEAGSNVRVTPRNCARSADLRNTSFHLNRGRLAGSIGAVPDMPLLPHRWFCPGSGEGRIGGSLLVTCIILITIVSVNPGGARAHMNPDEGTALESTSTFARGTTTQPILESDLIPVVRSHIASATEWRPEEIEIRSLRNLHGLERPEGAIAFRVSRDSAASNYRNTLLPVEVVIDDRFHRMIWISADIRIKATVVQAARRLRYGSAITEGDLRAECVEIKDARKAYIRDPHEAVGMILRRAVAEGEPLTRDMLSRPLLVRSGEMVRLRLRRAAVRLTMNARAEQSGRLGQFIRVRNIDFSRTLRAQVVGRGEVAIQ